MPVRVRYYTDPACSASWAAEPLVRRLQVEFGDEVQITYLMCGLARRFEADPSALATEWLNASERSGMPVDPRAWGGPGALGSSYPASMAVKAAAEQGPPAAERYLRLLREGIMCRRRKLDSTEALVEEARAAGLDAERFRIDLGSHAIVEAFAADLEETRALRDELLRKRPARPGAQRPPPLRKRPARPGAQRPPPLALPSIRFAPGDPGERLVEGGSWEEWRAAAIAAGAAPSPGPRPDVEAALRRFGRLAGPEVEAVCDLPGPRAPAELWRLASEWRVKPTRYLTGELWELP